MRTWLIVVAVLAGAILLISSLALIALVLAIALLPVALWIWITGKRPSRASVVIEGTARRVDEEAVVLPASAEEERKKPDEKRD